jgi:NAD(P)-dependent dehydrogenase (short-subunit alcohol dehydrogenase family)
VLDGKIALVTGATKNTGWAIARTLAAHGAAVCVHGTSLDVAQARAAELAQEFPGQPHLGVTGDLRDTGAIAAMFGVIEARFGKLDVMVANACNQGATDKAFADLPIDFFDDVWAVNVRGHIACAQHSVRLMQGRGGAIVFVGSNTAGRAIRNRSAYIASKGAINSLTRALALDLAPLGIRVNEAAPGYINTERWETLDPAIATRRRANLPLGREATGEDVGEVVAFLASDRAAAMTGALVPVSAGIDIQMVPKDCEG